MGEVRTPLWGWPLALPLPLEPPLLVRQGLDRKFRMSETLRCEERRQDRHMTASIGLGERRCQRLTMRLTMVVMRRRCPTTGSSVWCGVRQSSPGFLSSWCPPRCLQASHRVFSVGRTRFKSESEVSNRNTDKKREQMRGDSATCEPSDAADIMQNSTAFFHTPDHSYGFVMQVAKTLTFRVM